MARASGKSSQSEQQVINGTEDAPAVNGETLTEAPPADAAAQKRELTPEARTKLAEIRGRIETSVGQVALLMMQLPRYRHQTLADLTHLIIEPLLSDRVAIAFSADEEGKANAGSAPVGVAIWASVSDTVDAKIREQVKAGTFPVRLGAEDWASGERLWLLDIVALSKKAASAVLFNFKRIAGEREVQLHPIVVSTVDPELLKRLKKS